MKKLIGLIGFTCMCAVMSLAQNVGIAEPAPNSKLDVVQTETTGNTLEVTHGITTNGSSSAWIKNSGTGYGLHVQNLLTSSNSSVARFLQLGTGGAAHGQLISMNGTTIVGTTGQYIDQLGLGLGSFTNMGSWRDRSRFRKRPGERTLDFFWATFWIWIRPRSNWILGIVFLRMT